MIPHVHSQECAHGHEHHHDKRFQEFLTALRSGNAKQTLKQIRKVLKKGVPSPTDMLLFRITEALALHKTGENAQAEKCLKDVSADLVKYQGADDHVITVFLYAAKSQGLAELSMDTLEKLYKANPKDNELAEKLFAECVASNKFYRLNLLAKELETRTHQEEYTLASIYSLYMFAKYGADRASPASKGYTKLAAMEFSKYIATHKIPADQLPVNLFDLQRQILLLSDSHAEVAKLAESQKSIPASKRTEALLESLKALGQHADCVNLLLREMTGNLQKGIKAEYIHESYQKLIGLLLGLYFEKMKDPTGMGITEIWEGREKLQVTLEAPITFVAENVVETIKKVFEVFVTVAERGKIGETAVSLNEVRGGYLALLFMLHKIVLFSLKSGQSEYASKLASSTMSKVAENYVRKFVSTASVYSDLLPYCTDFSVEDRQKIVSAVKEVAEGMEKMEPPADYAKLLSAKILYYKLKVSLVPIVESELISLAGQVADLYTSARKKVDKKLEKGERHPADDLILVLDYILSRMDKEEAKMKVINPTAVLRIMMLDKSLRDSPANFDFAIKLLKLLMGHNLNYMTREIYDNMRIKGVLTETLGYVYEKYLMEYLHPDKFNEVAKKYEKFVAKNGEELGGIKVKAVKESNFAQAEELYQYEVCHNNSQHHIVIDTAGSLLEYVQTGQSRAITGGTSKIVEQMSLLKDGTKLQKNQDVYTVQDRIKRVPELKEYEGEIKKAFGMDLKGTWEGLILDPVLVPHMALGKTNYRENVANLFGVLELPQLNLLLHSLCLISAKLSAGDFTNLKGEFDNFAGLFAAFETAVGVATSSKIFHEYQSELADLLVIFQYVSRMVKLLGILHDMKISKDIKSIGIATEILNDARKYAEQVIGTLKKPADSAQSLIDSLVMRRICHALEYFGTTTGLLFSAAKIVFPQEIAKKGKKGEPASAGETFKKAVNQLKKDITTGINEVLLRSQGAKLSEETGKGIFGWETMPEGIMKVPMIQGVVGSENSKEIVKKIKEEIVSGVSHVEVVFRPMIKSLAAIDI